MKEKNIKISHLYSTFFILFILLTGFIVPANSYGAPTFFVAPNDYPVTFSPGLDEEWKSAVSNTFIEFDFNTDFHGHNCVHS